MSKILKEIDRESNFMYACRFQASIFFFKLSLAQNFYDNFVYTIVGVYQRFSQIV